MPEVNGFRSDFTEPKPEACDDAPFFQPDGSFLLAAECAFSRLLDAMADDLEFCCTPDIRSNALCLELEGVFVNEELEA